MSYQKCIIDLIPKGIILKSVNNLHFIGGYMCDHTTDNTTLKKLTKNRAL